MARSKQVEQIEQVGPYQAYDSGGDFWIILGPGSRRFTIVGPRHRGKAEQLAELLNRAYEEGFQDGKQEGPGARVS